MGDKGKRDKDKKAKQTSRKKEAKRAAQRKKQEDQRVQIAPDTKL